MAVAPCVPSWHALVSYIEMRWLSILAHSLTNPSCSLWEDVSRILAAFAIIFRGSIVLLRVHYIVSRKNVV